MSKLPEDSVNVSPVFQKRIKELVADEECGNAEFADRCGISRNIVSAAVNYGILPTVKTLVKIADHVGRSFAYVLGMSDEPAFEPAENPASFHERLLLLIRENNMKFSDVTNHPKATFSRNSIHVWIKRKNLPALEFLLQLAEIFRVSPDYLLGRTDYKN